MESFFCTQCGRCCTQITKVSELKELDRGDGVCCNLKDNLCQIYETRPLQCRVDEMFKQVFCSTYDRGNFYELNYQMCKKLQLDQNNLGK